jgi:hypothetical protein
MIRRQKNWEPLSAKFCIPAAEGFVMENQEESAVRRKCLRGSEVRRNEQSLWE